jgi:hypothetical protein
LKIPRIIAKSSAHPVGVFSMRPNPPRCHIRQQHTKKIIYIYIYIYIYIITSLIQLKFLRAPPRIYAVMPGYVYLPDPPDSPETPGLPDQTADGAGPRPYGPTDMKGHVIQCTLHVITIPGGTQMCRKYSAPPGQPKMRLSKSDA